MKLTGNWDAQSTGQYVKQTQTHLGELGPRVDAYAEARHCRRAGALRALWGVVLASDVDVEPVPLVRGVDDSENLACVPVTREMWEAIEKARGNVPRGTLLRAMTAAGLDTMKDSQ